MQFRDLPLAHLRSASTWSIAMVQCVGRSRLGHVRRLKGCTGALTQRAKKPKYNTLDAGRGLAATAVTLHHAGQEPLYRHGAIMASAFAGLALGVAYFFVLSGTVIVLAHWRHIGAPGYALTYLRKRARRIYPVYWLALITWLLFSLRKLPPLYALTDGAVLVRFFADDYKFFPPSWTLYYEISFYMVFLGLILHRRLGLLGLAVWWLGALLSFRPQYVDFGAYPSSVQLLFGLGAYAGWLLVKGKRIYAPMLLVSAGGGLLAVLVVLSAVRPGMLQQGTYLAAGFGALLLILGSAELELREHLRVPASLKFLGAASYAIYLFHPMFQSLCARVLKRVQLHVALSDWTVLLVVFAVSLTGGCAMHQWVERPMMRWINQRNPVA